MKYFTILSFILLSFAASAQVTDGGFEAGGGSGVWTEVSTNFNTPLCDENCGTCGGPCAPNTGDNYAWFGGANAVETGSVEQSVVFPMGTAISLDMMVFMALPGEGLIEDRLEISVDDNILMTITSHDSTDYKTEYTLLSIDVNSLADGNLHTLKIEGFQSTDSIFNILVDDIDLIVDGNSTGLFDQMMAEEGLFLYPNPAKDVVNLEFRDIDGEATIRITNLSGALVSEFMIAEVAGGTYTFDTSKLANGIYSVNVSNKAGMTTKKLVVSH